MSVLSKVTGHLPPVKLDHPEIGPESLKNAQGLLRCPACYAVKDYLLPGFACQLSRCPRRFVVLGPWAGQQPTARVEGKAAQR